MRPCWQFRTLSNAVMGGSRGKWHTKRFLTISLCSLCTKMPSPNLETPPGPHLHQCEYNPQLCGGCVMGLGEGGRKVWAPASPDTFLHHLLLAFSPRSFFHVTALGITVPLCFCGKKTVDFSQVSPSLFAGETSLVHHKTQHVFQKWSPILALIWPKCIEGP